MTESAEANNSAKAILVLWLRKSGSISGTFALGLVVVGMIVRVMFRDQYVLSALIYYVMSPASMVLLLSFSAACLRKESWLKRRVGFGLIPVAVCWVVGTQWISNVPSDRSPSELTHRLMFWNACEGKLGWSKVFDTISNQHPDIIALAEAETLKIKGDDFFAKHFPGYQRVYLPRRLLLLSRLPIVSRRRLRWIKGAVHESVVIETHRGPFTLVFSDVASTLSLHRREPVATLVEATTGLEGPVISVGDLNTPVDSMFFDEFRQSFTNAFEGSGNGLHTTWPMPFPVIAIDQMWGNDRIRFFNARILWTLASDHRPVIADFYVRDSPLTPF